MAPLLSPRSIGSSRTQSPEGRRCGECLGAREPPRRLTFSLHAHKPMARNATPRNCGTEKRETDEGSLCCHVRSDFKRQLPDTSQACLQDGGLSTSGSTFQTCFWTRFKHLCQEDMMGLKQPHLHNQCVSRAHAREDYFGLLER